MLRSMFGSHLKVIPSQSRTYNNHSFTASALALGNVLLVHVKQASSQANVCQVRKSRLIQSTYIRYF